LNNILSQKKEIKRLEKTREKEEKEGEEERNRNEDEAKERAVQEFERVQMGLEAKVGSSATGRKIVGREDGKIFVEEDVVGGKRGEKRKFELDEDELLRIAREERTKARKAIDDEKVCICSIVSMYFELTFSSRRPRRLCLLSGYHQSRLPQIPAQRCTPSQRKRSNPQYVPHHQQTNPIIIPFIR
jgi:hypothetical protein